MDKTNSLAVAAMIIGIFSLFMSGIPFLGLILGALALIFGIISVRKIHLKGKGMAITGIVLGGIVLIINLSVIGNMSPENFVSKSSASTTTQTTNPTADSQKLPMLYGMVKDDYSRIPKDCRFLVSAQTPATLVQNEKSFRVYRVELSKDEFYIIACDLENTKSYCDINAGGYTALTPSQCRMINPDNY